MIYLASCLLVIVKIGVAIGIHQCMANAVFCIDKIDVIKTIIIEYSGWQSFKEPGYPRTVSAFAYATAVNINYKSF